MGGGQTSGCLPQAFQVCFQRCQQIHISDTFPIIAAMGSAHLAAPEASVPSEQAFSAGKKVMRN